MNRINPLYILVLFLVLAVVSFNIVNDKEKDFLNKNKQYNSLVIKAKEYKSLKLNNIKTNRVVAIINQISTSSEFKKAQIKTNKSKRGISLSIQSVDSKILKRFINKVLNEKLSIVKLDIKATKISLEVGI